MVTGIVKDSNSKLLWGVDLDFKKGRFASPAKLGGGGCALLYHLNLRSRFLLPLLWQVEVHPLG